MSYSSALARFNRLASTHRQQVYSGDRDADGFNFRLGDTRFLAAYTKLTTAIDVVTHGQRMRCTMKIFVCRSLSLPIDENSVIIHIPTGETYEVMQIGIDNPAAPEIPLLLHRREP